MVNRKKSSVLRDGIEQLSEETDGGLSRMSSHKLVEMANNTRSIALVNAAVNLIRKDNTELSSVYTYGMVDSIADIAKYVIKDRYDARGKELVLLFIEMASSIEDINAQSNIVAGTGRTVYELSIKGFRPEAIRDVMLFVVKTYEAGIKVHREDDAARVAEMIPSLAYTMEKPEESMRVVKCVLDSLKSDFDCSASAAATSAR